MAESPCLAVAMGKNEFGPFISGGVATVTAAGDGDQLARLTAEGMTGKLTLARRYLDESDPRARWSLEQLLDHVLNEHEASAAATAPFPWNVPIFAVKAPKTKKRPAPSPARVPAPSAAATAGAPDVGAGAATSAGNAAVAATVAGAAAGGGLAPAKRQKTRTDPVEVYYWNFFGRAGTVSALRSC